MADEGSSPTLGRPPDEDLSPILRRLVRRRRTKEAQKRLANDRLTREYLDAGLRLITEQMTARGNADDEAEDDARPFFGWLSKHKIIEEVGRGGGLQGSEGSFRDRWEFRGDYIEDLLVYALWARHWSLVASVAEESRELLTHSVDFVHAIHQVAYRDLCTLLDNPAYKISIIGAATAARDDTARDAIAETYRVITDSWSSLYKMTLEARGLKLRPGVTLREITDMLTAMADGLGLRIIADPGSPLIDHDRQESLLGKAALAFVIACVDIGDGQSIEDLVRTLSRPL